MATEAPSGARAGLVTWAEAAAVMTATTAATEEVEKVADTAVAEEAPARAAGATGDAAPPRVERTTRVRAEITAPAPPRTGIWFLTHCRTGQGNICPFSGGGGGRASWPPKR